MGKGSPQAAAPTTTTVNQQKLPDYAQPYLEQTLAQGQALGQNAYTPYPGEQIAPLAPQQFAAMDAANHLPDASAGAFSGAQSALSGAANYNPMMVNSTYSPTPGGINSIYGGGSINSNYNAGQFGPQSWLDPGTSQAFMDPYQKQVTAETIKQINQQGDLQNAQINSNAISAGAFGGDRATVAHGLNDYYTQQNVGQAAAQGGQAAYQSGMNQFNTQQNMGLSAFQQNQGAQQQMDNLRLQAFGASQGAQQQAGQQSLTAQQANEQSRQFGGQQTFAAQQANQQALAQANQMRLTAGQDMGYLGTSQQNAALQNQQALQNSGALLQAQQQSTDNVAYQNFLNQLNFPYQQIGFQSSLINGLPVGSVGTSAAYQNPNTVSQMLGLGLGGLGLSQALGKA